MKLQFKTLLLILLLSFSGQTNAQFFKKLKKTAEKAVERTVLNRADREVSETADRTLDSLTRDDGQQDRRSSERDDSEAAQRRAMSLFGGSFEDIPNSYAFSYVMNMQLTSNKDQANLQYYIEPEASYFGNAIPTEGNKSIIVYDMETQAMVTFMDNDGRKMAMRIEIPFDEHMQELISNPSEETGDMTTEPNIKVLPNKTILGYTCKGYQIEQEKGVSNMYITDEAPVSFLGMFTGVGNAAKSLDSNTIVFGKNSMLMEMEFISNKRKKDNVHMVCTAITEKSFTINKSDYQGM